MIQVPIGARLNGLESILRLQESPYEVNDDVMGRALVGCNAVNTRTAEAPKTFAIGSPGAIEPEAAEVRAVRKGGGGPRQGGASLGIQKGVKPNPYILEGR